MRTAILAILVIAALAIGGGLIATTAYQAGLAADVTVVQPATDGTVVAPLVVPGYGYGWGWHGFGPGFGFFGILGTIFVLFLLIGLIRFAFRGPRGWGGSRGWGGPGGPGRHDGAYPWEARAHQAFDDWHRTAHGPTAEPPAGDTTARAS